MIHRALYHRVQVLNPSLETKEVSRAKQHMGFYMNSGDNMEKACKAFAVDLSAFLDGELNTAEAKIVSEHVAHCTHCQDSLAKMRKIHEAMGSLVRQRPTGSGIISGLMGETQPAERKTAGSAHNSTGIPLQV